MLQSCYASLISGAALVDTLADQLDRRESAPETVQFARHLTDLINRNRGDLQTWLGRLISANWKPERLGVLEKVILTMGLAELRFCPDVPYKVVINEALELTRRYCDEDAVGFVNGVLDKAAAEVYGPLDEATS